ncbi:MAG TPA: hypothetical protein PKC23_06990 [Candidatus Desulfobacillus sp.]|mgnify:CR=1 FL=1|nr:hypothetical protein [Candidatus Desulfobacillus sp.]
MERDLLALEERIEQFIALCQGLRAENQALRTQVGGLEAERKRLNEKIETACARLEALMEKIPE